MGPTPITGVLFWIEREATYANLAPVVLDLISALASKAYILNEYFPCAVTSVLGALKMRVRKIRVLENASTLVSTENASTVYASTVDRPGKC